MRILPDPIKFDWDKGNKDKNWRKHRVTSDEAEEVFDNEPRFFFEDTGHSDKEQRSGLFGQTDGGRLLSLVFTIRKNKIRVVTARDMSRKERRSYEEIKKNPPL